MITDQVNGPRAEQNERRSHSDDGSADHDGAPFIIARVFPGAAEAFLSGEDQARRKPARRL